MTALITGLQPIGRYILDRLSAQGSACKALTGADDVGSMGGADLIAGAIEDDAALTAAVRDVDTVYHTALVARGTPEEVRHTNTEGTRRLLEACAGDIRRFVLISTPAVYASHPTADSWPVLADEPREAHGRPSLLAYGQSMIEAEDLVMEASQHYGMEYTLLRTATAWGRNPYPQGLVKLLMENPSQAERLNRALGPLQWIHGTDAASGAVLAASAEQARNLAFIVAAEKPITAFDLLVALWEITNPSEANPFTEAAAPHRLSRVKLDTSKIAQALEFKPKVSLRECLEEALGLSEIATVN